MKRTPDHPAGVEVAGTRHARVLADLRGFLTRYDQARAAETGGPVNHCQVPRPVAAARAAAIAAAIRADCFALGLAPADAEELIATAQQRHASGQASAAAVISEARDEARRRVRLSEQTRDGGTYV